MNLKIFMSILLFLSFSFSSLGIVDNDTATGVYFSFDDKDLSGSNPLDLTPNSRNGLNTGATSGVSGVLNEAFDFDGSNDEVIMLSIVPQPKTISMWVNVDVRNRLDALLGHSANTTSYMYWRDDGTSNDLIISNGRTFGAITKTINTDYHFVFVQNGSDVDLYVDGVYTATASSTDLQGFNEIGARTSGGTNQWFDGTIDEFSIWNRSLIQSEIDFLYNNGSLTLDQQFPFSIPTPPSNITEHVEKTIFGQQVGTASISGGSWNTVLSANFNVTTNNTDIYMSVVSALLSNQDTLATCRINVTGDHETDDLFNSTLTYSLSANEINNMRLKTHVFSLQNGSYTGHLQCLKISHPYDIFNSVATGHFLIDEQNKSINFKSKHFVATTNSTNFVLVDSFNITINDTASTNGTTQNLIVDWNGDYTNNAGGVEELNTYISVNGTNCGEYSRGVHPSTTISASGGCVFKNVTAGDIYTINTYAKGSNASFHIETVAKNFYNHYTELGGVLLNNTIVNSSVFQDIASFNITIEAHDTVNFFVETGIPHISDELGNLPLRIHIQDGSVNFTSPTFVRSNEDTHNHIMALQYLVQNIPSDTYVVSLQALTDVSQINITGGDFYGYMTDSKAATPNGFNVSVFDYFDNSGIDNFSVTLSNNAVFSTTLGYIFVFSDLLLENLTFSSNFNSGYFSTSVLNHNTSNDLNVSLNQTLVSWNCLEKVSGSDLSCSSPLESQIFNYNIIGNPHSQSINVSGYFERIVFFNVSALQNETLNISFYSTNLSINSSSIYGAVSFCTYNISSFNHSFSESVFGSPFTTTGIINGSYSVLADCTGFALKSLNVSIENITQSINFDLLINNNVNFTFYDEKFPDILLVNLSISLDLLSSGTSSYNTSVGFIFVDNLSGGDYEARYDAVGFDPRSFFFTVTERSTNSISLYLSNSSLTELYVIRVVDQIDQGLEGVTVRLQRQFISMNGQFVTVEECKTDSDGECPMFIEESAAVIYRFIVIVDGVTVLTTIEAPIITLPDQQRVRTLRVVSGATGLDAFNTQLGIFGELTYDNNTKVVSYEFLDTKNSIVQGCLVVERKHLDSSSYTSISEDCLTTFSGTINKNISSFILNDTQLRIRGFVDFVNARELMDETFVNGDKTFKFQEDKNDELLLSALVVGALGLVLSQIPNLLISVPAVFLVLLIFSIFQFNSIAVGSLFLLFLLAIAFNWNRKQTRRVP